MPVSVPLYPVNLLVSGQRCLVVGGGVVAAAKVAGLLECEAAVHVVAPLVRPVTQMLGDGLTPPASLRWDERRYTAADLDGAYLVITATDDPTVNAAVFADATERGIWCNSADDPANCSFTLPSRVRQGDLLVTFSTRGRSPALSRWLRETYTEEFGSEYATLMDMLAEERETIVAAGRSTEGLAWQEALSSGMLELIREGRLAEAKERLQACLSSSSV